MSQPFQHPELNPQFCFNEQVLRDFLRLSRGTIDDSIIQNLNAFMRPASRSFDPRITNSRQTPAPPPVRKLLDQSSCDHFRKNILFPSWQVRSDVLNYCAGVATSPDPDDPQSLLREVENAQARERVVDERLDPYSARYFPREARTESLASLIRNERNIEKIVRLRSWSILMEKCGGPLNETADSAFDKWRTT